MKLLAAAYPVFLERIRSRRVRRATPRSCTQVAHRFCTAFPQAKARSGPARAA